MYFKELLNGTLHLSEPKVILKVKSCYHVNSSGANERYIVKDDGSKIFFEFMFHLMKG